jgi:hypothetical protein
MVASQNLNFVAILRYSQKITPYIPTRMPRRDFLFAPLRLGSGQACLAYNQTLASLLA